MTACYLEDTGQRSPDELESCNLASTDPARTVMQMAKPCLQVDQIRRGWRLTAIMSSSPNKINARNEERTKDTHSDSLAREDDLAVEEDEEKLLLP